MEYSDGCAFSASTGHAHRTLLSRLTSIIARFGSESKRYDNACSLRRLSLKAAACAEEEPTRRPVHQEKLTVIGGALESAPKGIRIPVARVLPH